ncbi:MAG: [protein-PII] uridylyltransferase [Actinomycetota bacterium]|nr:[protein-PII] uridylyltransferase [Actinomycetota bacterium]
MPDSLRSARTALLARTDVTGVALRTALVELYDGWLASLFGEQGPGISLVAVGALGRRDPAPGSDLDLVLVHDGRDDIAERADELWYPIWDTGVGLDHSVRTVAEAVAVARADLKAALGLLDARHLAGDESLSAALISATRAVWRQGAASRLPQLRAFGEERARTAGEVAFLLEPDLKEARGGLRDVHALHALAVAQVADPPSGPTLAAYELLLDVRGELHRRAAGSGRRTVDRLVMQEQDAIAAALGHSDADRLMAAVSGAARTIAFSSDVTWRRVSVPAPRRRILGRRGAIEPVRRPIGDDVLEQAGEVVLARNAVPADDPELLLRVAEAAARNGLPIAPHTLDRLAAECPPIPVPWPRTALDAFIGLLAAGPACVPVFEALDQARLLTRLLPEWESVRSKPQRNSYHRFTVDRHLVEAAAEAAALTRRVARPDLLLLGALLHDIGKGLPGDHTETGMQVVAQIAPRLGLVSTDAEVLVAMVRHHLLLPDVATRRDLADPATAQAVADAVGSAEVLELLHALTEADAAATGPAVWSSWKAGLVDQLVARTAALLAGTVHVDDTSLSPRQEALVIAGVLALDVDGDEITVVAPDRPGLLSLSAGVLALHRLDVRSASAFARGSTAVTVFRVTPRFGSPPDWSVVRNDLARAVDGSLDVERKLAAKEAAYAPRTVVSVAPPTVRLVDDASESATVVEVRAPDGLGILHRITTALDECGLDVRTAHISTLGADVVDAFYVVGAGGTKVTDPAQRSRIESSLLAALSTPGRASGEQD